MFQNHQEEHLLDLEVYNFRMNINIKYEEGKIWRVKYLRNKFHKFV